MSASLHATFAALHDADRPLLLPNAWDAASARLWQEAGAKAVATSSAALAWSRGYADDNALPRTQLLAALHDILRVVSVPVTADIEAGYSDAPDAVAGLVAELVEAGVVGINLEDGGGAPEALVAKIRAIRACLGNAPLFINARTDVYLRGLASGEAAVAMAIERLRLYAGAGADGGFVPGLASAADAGAIAAAVPLAINVMAIPGLASPAALAAAGVRRISAATWLFKTAYGAGLRGARDYLAGNFDPCFDHTLDYDALNRMFAQQPSAKLL